MVILDAKLDPKRFCREAQRAILRRRVEDPTCHVTYRMHSPSPVSAVRWWRAGFRVVNAKRFRWPIQAFRPPVRGWVGRNNRKVGTRLVICASQAQRGLGGSRKRPALKIYKPVRAL